MIVKPSSLKTAKKRSKKKGSKSRSRRKMDDLPVDLAPPLPAANNNDRRAPGPVRRRNDGRLWESLDDDQIRAAEMIYQGFRLRVPGAAFRTQVFSLLPRQARRASDRGGQLLELYAVWAGACQAEGLCVGAALDIIVFGRTLRAVDRHYGRRNGFARCNLLEALECFDPHPPRRVQHKKFVDNRGSLI
jgi:hypothetical protein